MLRAFSTIGLFDVVQTYEIAKMLGNYYMFYSWFER